MANYDQMAAAVKELSGGKNIVLLDDMNLPSIYVPINRLKMSELISGGSENVHPAFSVNGVEKDTFYYSKYQNIIINGRAYSLAHRDPAVNINFDNARQACEAKGAGFHLSTLAEWACIALWCRKTRRCRTATATTAAMKHTPMSADRSPQRITTIQAVLLLGPARQRGVTTGRSSAFRI